MALADLIRPEVVKVPLAGKTKNEVLRELVQVLLDAGKIGELESVYDALLAREALGSTGLELGVAVPHAKTSAVRRLTAAIGIAPQGVDFLSADGQPAKLFFLLLAPPDQSGPHIQALAEIARLAKSPTFLRLLSSASSAQEVTDLIREG
jgi:mannitol/fructose-specific phosphotransferase system IIA component (Ntr-type)